MYDKFLDHIKFVANYFKEWDKSEPIKLVSHLDSDGISSVSIIKETLNKENIKSDVQIIQQLTKKYLQTLNREKFKYIIFSDIGSSVIEEMTHYLKNKKIIILDHHSLPKNYETILDENRNIRIINPHIFGIDGSAEISGSGVCYLFSKEINPNNTSLSYLALVGALGDMQERTGKFLELNNNILNDAKENNIVDVEKSLKLFGAQTRPLNKVLEYSTEPFIPGVTHSPEGTTQFLEDIGIPMKKDMRWTKLNDLTKEQMISLSNGIIEKRKGKEKDPENIYGPKYVLLSEDKKSAYRDLKEFSTILNSCGRLNKIDTAISACLLNPEGKQKAEYSLREYKRSIVVAMNWYKNNEFIKNKIHKGNNYLILNARNDVLPTIIGTVSSILSRSGKVKDGIFILSLARFDDGNTKVSLRIGNKRKKKLEHNLKKILSGIISDLGEGYHGGHYDAAGALIPTELENKFIDIAIQHFSYV